MIEITEMARKAEVTTPAVRRKAAAAGKAAASAASQAAAATAADPRWARVMARDATADGEFWYSVATTGVYCRPSCPSRRANPINVAIHDTLEDARRTGFRPCRRCRPEDSSPEAARAAIVAEACQRIEASDESLPLADLAKPSGLSPGRFH